MGHLSCYPGRDWNICLYVVYSLFTPALGRFPSRIVANILCNFLMDCNHRLVITLPETHIVPEKMGIPKGK